MSLFDFFRPQWKKTDPDERLRAVRDMQPDQQALLRDVARKDPEPRVRKAALQKINDLDALAALEAAEADPELKVFLRQKIGAGALQLLKKTPNPELIDRWFPRIRDNSALCSLLREAALPEIRLLCVEKIKAEQDLAHAARQDADEKVAAAALAKVSKPEPLSEIAKTARHASVKKAAAERLAAMESEERSKEAERLEAMRASALKATLRRLAEESHLAAMEETVDELVSEARAMAAEESDEELSALAGEIVARLEAERKARAMKLAQEMEEREERTKFEEILVELQSLAHLSDLPQAAQSRFEELKASWNDLAAKASRNVTERLAPKFDEVCANVRDLFSAEEEKAERAKRELQEKLRAEKDRAAEEIRRQAEEKHAAFRKKLDALEELIAKARDLDPETEFDAAVLKLQELRRQWNETVGDEREKFAKAWRRFRQAASAFQEVEGWELWHNESEKEKLLEEAEALSAQEDEKTIVAEAKRLQNAWRRIGHVARGKHEEMRERFAKAIDAALGKCAGYLEKLEEEKKANLEAKKALLEEIKAFAAESEADGKAAQKMKELQERWRGIGPLPSQEESDALWAECKEATSAFFKKRREQMKVEKADRLVALERKTKLCEEAEAISGSTDWEATSAKFLALQKRWKESGPVPRSESEAVWKRFRAACDAFFDAKRAHFDAIDETRRKNLGAKSEICDRLEALSAQSDPAAVAEALALADKEWKAIGPVPRKESDALWERYCAAQDSLVDAARAASPEFAAEIAKKLDGKRAILERARALADSNDWKATGDALKEMRAEWTALGRAGKDEDPLRVEFEAICDDFFSRRRDQFDILDQMRKNNLERKMVLVEQAERLAERGPSEETRREARMMRQQWKSIGPVPKRDAEKIWARFDAACNALFPNKGEQND